MTDKMTPEEFELYVHCEKESAWDTLYELSFDWETHKDLRYAGYEHKVKYKWSVDEDGHLHSQPVEFDGIPLDVEAQRQQGAEEERGRILSLGFNMLPKCPVATGGYSWNNPRMVQQWYKKFADKAREAQEGV